MLEGAERSRRTGISLVNYFQAKRKLEILLIMVSVDWKINRGD